jgi:phospholipid transport system substrate-binding protein
MIDIDPRSARRAMHDLFPRSLCVALALCAGVPVNSIGQTDELVLRPEPVAVVAQLHSGLISTSDAFADAPIEERYAALEPLIIATHDLPYIARFAMRRYWADLADQQRSEFLDAFTRLSIATYARRFQGLREDSFSIAGQTDTPRGHAEINGTLLPDEGEPLELTYVLHRSGQDWRIINIVVDGVSDLALKRAEYQREFSDTGFSGLMDYLSAQISELMPTSSTNSE